ATQYWDGTNTVADGTIHGGSSTWDNVTTNWTNATASVNAPWQSEVAIFEGTTGTVTLGDNIHFSGMEFMTDGYTIVAPGAQTLIAAAATTIDVGSGLTATISAPIVDGTSPAAITKTDLGTLILTGTNTYTGGTTISGGTLQLGNGGTSGSITGNVTDNGTLAFDRSDAVTIGVVVSGTGSLVQLGGGTLILTADNTYTGGTIVNAGTLQLGDGTNTTSLAGANGSNGFPGGAGKDAVTVNNSATFNVMTNASVSVGAGGDGAGLSHPGNGGEAVSFSAGGSLTNSGTISGGAAGTAGSFGGVNGTGGFGVLFSGAAGTLTNQSGGIINGGVMMGNFANDVTLDTGSVINGTLNLGPSIAATLTLEGTGTQLYSTAVTGATTLNGALIKNGTGTWTLDESFTYTGGTTINAGTLALGSGGSIALSSGLSLAASGAGFDISAGGNQTIQDLSGVAGSTINLGANTLSVGTANSTSFAGVISGSGALTKQGGGTLTLSGANTYVGPTTVDDGTLALGSGGSIALSSGLALAASGAGFDISAGSNQTIQDLSGVAGSTINLGANTLSAGTAHSTSFAGIISGTGGLTKQGGGTLTLSGLNSYSGGTSFNGGILAVNSDSNLGTGPLSFNGGTLEALAAGGGITSSKAIMLNAGGGTFLADAGTSSILNGSINGVGSLTKDGLGTLTLTGTNTYSGGTNIAEGILQAGSSTALSTNSAFSVISLLDLHGFNNTIGSLSGTGVVTNNGGSPATLTVGGNNTNTTFSGTLTDGTSSLGFTKTGTGTLILGGANTYSGGTIVNNGTLLVNNSQALGLGNVVVNGGVLGADPQPINVKGNYTQNA